MQPCGGGDDSGCDGEGNFSSHSPMRTDLGDRERVAEDLEPLVLVKRNRALAGVAPDPASGGIEKGKSAEGDGQKMAADAPALNARSDCHAPKLDGRFFGSVDRQSGLVIGDDGQNFWLLAFAGIRPGAESREVMGSFVFIAGKMGQARSREMRAKNGGPNGENPAGFDLFDGEFEWIHRELNIRRRTRSTSSLRPGPAYRGWRPKRWIQRARSAREDSPRGLCVWTSA